MSFKDIFKEDCLFTNKAHARVNLIGEHTDYTGGYVMPCLLNFNTTIQISKNKSISLIFYKGWEKNNTLDPAKVNKIFGNQLKQKEFMNLDEAGSELIYLIS